MMKKFLNNSEIIDCNIDSLTFKPTFSFIKIITITTVIIFITKFFQSTPFEKEFFQIQAGFIVLMFFYFLKELINIKKYKAEPILKYFLFLIILTPIYSAFRANLVFDQSYYLGLLVMRGVFLIMATHWIYNYLLADKISFKYLEDIFIWLSWLSIFVFTFIFFFVNPDSFVDSSFVNYDPLRGYLYKFQTVLVTFTTLYYLIRYRDKGKLKDIISYLLLLTFALFIISGRGNILLLLFVSSLIMIKDIKASKILKLFAPILFGLIFIYFLSDTLFSKFLPDFLVRLNEAFATLGGEVTLDPSANSRILQSGIIFDFLSKNISSIWFGVGHLSNQFLGTGSAGGYNAIFGYLYPTDTGLIGVLFTWGIIGLIFLYLIPVAFIIKVIKNTSIDKNIFVTTINYFLLYVLIGSLYTGNIVFDPAFIFFVMGIKMAYNKKYIKKLV